MPRISRAHWLLSWLLGLPPLAPGDVLLREASNQVADGQSVVGAKFQVVGV